ncbi:MAG: hypothetical protein KBT46_09925, partial [Ruminococcus sp.]|nr:hypothetical protein [Candidatus Copronaster equi]
YMNNEIKNQIIKSATAILCVAALSITSVQTVDKLVEAKASLGTSTASVEENTPVADNGSDVSSNENNTVDTQNEVADDTQENTDNTAADESSDTQSSDTGSSTGSKSDAPKNNSSKSDNTKKASSNIPSSKAEIINYCNTALNKAKAAKVGYSKKFVRKGGDNLPSAVAKIIAADKNTTMKKGSNDIIDDFPAAGYSWSSKLRENDVASATLTQSGQYYDIVLKLGKETNPGKGESSSYGRVMSVIDANDAKGMLPGIKSINMSYHDGYVKARVDSKTGKLVSAEFSATADIEASVAVFGDLKANNLISTETFTNIIW